MVAPVLAGETGTAAEIVNVMGSRGGAVAAVDSNCMEMEAAAAVADADSSCTTVAGLEIVLVACGLDVYVAASSVNVP